MTERLAKPPRCGQGRITLADTFVADGRDGDLLFSFYRAVATHEGVCTPDHWRRFRWNLPSCSVSHVPWKPV